jgi:hypothetical protein
MELQQYKVLTLSMSGKRNKLLRAGDIITKNDLDADKIPFFLTKKYIEKHEELILPNIEPNPLDPNKKIKVGIVSAVWGREFIFQLFAKGITHLIKSIPEIDFEVIIAGSEKERSKKMVENWGFKYIEMPNEPLASKHNATTLLAGKLNCDYVLCLGSDDIIHPDLMKSYIKYMKKGFDYIGVLDFYFYDTITKKCSYWGGYMDERRKNHTCGAGRLISKRLLTLWNWKPWEIKDSKVLDNSMQTKLKATPHSIRTFYLKDENVFGLDIKSSTNMTPFALWDNTVYIDEKIIKEKFNYLHL